MPSVSGAIGKRLRRSRPIDGVLVSHADRGVDSATGPSRKPPSNSRVGYAPSLRNAIRSRRGSASGASPRPTREAVPRRRASRARRTRRRHRGRRRAVDPDDPADVRQADATLVEEDRQDHPDERIDELFDEARLRDCGEPSVAPGHQREDLARGRIGRHTLWIARSECAWRGAGMPRGLRMGPRQRVPHPDQCQDKPRQHHGEAEDEQADPRTESRCGVARENAGERHAHIAGELVQADR